MASVSAAKAVSLKPDGLDRVLSGLAAVLLACVVAALLRGMAQWPQVPVVVWPHVLTIIVALGLTPVMLLRRRGDRNHRALGYVWVGAMLLAALSSFAVRVINPGQFSWIHVLSIYTLIQVPLIVLHARRRNHRKHRNAVRGMVIGALLIAGFFTFPFDRLLGHWLFG